MVQRGLIMHGRILGLRKCMDSTMCLFDSFRKEISGHTYSKCGTRSGRIRQEESTVCGFLKPAEVISRNKTKKVKLEIRRHGILNNAEGPRIETLK